MSKRAVNKANELFTTFHQFEPKGAGKFVEGFTIPHQVYLSGDASEIMYRSDKWEKESHDYVHDHEAGVKVYHTKIPNPPSGETRAVNVPQYIRSAKALVRLGYCLGFSYHNGEELVEAHVRSPYPELYTIPSGKALLVVVGKRRIEAMIWGGNLHITAHGIIA